MQSRNLIVRLNNNNTNTFNRWYLSNKTSTKRRFYSVGLPACNNVVQNPSKNVNKILVPPSWQNFAFVMHNKQCRQHQYHNHQHQRLLTSSSIQKEPELTINKATKHENKTFTKILIANRGEISRRIIQTCKKLNIQTVAIYSTADSKSPHVQEADESICVGPTASSDSYLHVDNVCKAIEMTGAQAVHPGYGFLSENAEFCKRVTDMNVKFIGPTSDAIVVMGDKITSKKIAKDAGVNVIPGYEDFVVSPDDAVRVANEIGYPVMIKATSGGGGKGMRVCYKDEQVREGFTLSTAEAKSFFNDERLFIEKFIEKPHHIEIQLLAGRKNGEKDLDILCFVERECSIQRRNQKIIEESPSTLLTPETRAEMVRQVKSLVRKVDYTSAGTVEFLVDEKQNFYFLEMNTRLQVEHPVTEMVSGDVDLVYGMINVAAGNGIPTEYLDLVKNGYDFTSLTPEDIDGLTVPHKGHAIEARIYAEDPVRGFLPATGPLLQYMEPPLKLPFYQSDDNDNDDGCRIRVDSGVKPGSIISQYYDPMISKLIGYSPNNRDESIKVLKGALDRYVIKGIGHNSSFLSDVLRNKSFIEGNTPTNFIDCHYPDGFTGVKLSDYERAELVAVAATVNLWRREFLDLPPLSLTTDSEEGAEVIVCIGGMFGNASIVKVTDHHSILVRHLPNNKNGENEESDVVPKEYEVSLDDIEYDVMNPIVETVINGEQKAFQIQNEDNTGVFNVHFEGAYVDCVVMSEEEYKLSSYMKEPKVVDTSSFILSPMPGTLMSYAVNDGDEVLDGQEICIVEAMKMQNVLRSVRSGVIKKCHAQVGSSLMKDERIVEFDT